MTAESLELTDIVWEQTSCNFCGSREESPLFSGPDRLAGLPGTFMVVACQNCGLVRQNPRPAWESLQHYYRDDYVSHVPIIDDEPSRWRRLDRRWGMSKLLRAVERVQKGGRLLDVGAGTGIFLAEAKRRGRWDVTGVEPSGRAAAYARERLNVPIFESLFPNPELDLLPESFDVITMWHVVEHLGDPLGSFREVHRLLRPGGWFVFAIPNYESWDARLFGRYWVGWDLPRHLFAFPRPALEDALRSCGLIVRDTRCLATTYALLRHDLEFWTQDWSPRFRFWGKTLLKIYNLTLTRVLLMPTLWWLGRLKRAPVITVFARKEKAGSHA